MKKRISSGYGLILFELIIAIAFFALFASIFLRIFLSAHKISEESAELSHAIITAQNAAETFKAGKNPPLFYTKNWEPAKESDAAYQLDFIISSENQVKTAIIQVETQNGDKIFSLTVKKQEETAP